MENNTKQKVLENIGKIYEQSKDCKLEDSFFNTFDNELAILTKYFKTTKNQAFFIAVVFALDYKGDTVDLNQLIQYFNCNPMKLLGYNDDFTYLFSEKIFESYRSKYGTKLTKPNEKFALNEKISEAILQNSPMPEINKQEAVRARIWKAKMLYLNEADCELLAGQFDFSGGQIDNILRKKEIQEIIHEEKVTLENLLSFCSEESFGNTGSKIGFSAYN